MQSRPVNLWLDSLEYSVCKKSDGEVYIDSVAFYQPKMALVVYSDSNTCSSCAMKGMFRWFEVLDTLRARYNSDIVTYFIFSPKTRQLEEFRQTSRNALFEHPIFIDTCGVFLRQNPHIPADNRMHTFLLDSKRDILLVGSPLGNHTIRSMFYKIVDDSLNMHGK